MANNNFEDIKQLLISPDFESENLGWNMLFLEPWFVEMRTKYANTSIAFWQFRRFGEICDYFEHVYLPQEGKDLSDEAHQMLKDYFFKFVENNS